MRALIVSSQPRVTTELEKVLHQAGIESRAVPVEPLGGALKAVEDLRPGLLIVDLARTPDSAIAVLRQGRQVLDGTVLAVGPVNDPKLHATAMREGADHYLVEEALTEELEAILARVRRQSRTMKAEPPRRGKLIAVLASTAGAGGSTLAVNLATALAQKHQDCVLIDLNLRGGDLATLLNLRPSHTLAELCANITRLDSVMFERSLIAHESGVRLLAPTQSLDDMAQISSQGVEQVINLALSVSPYVVIDLDDYFHVEQIQTLRQADQILLVLRLDFTCLRNARRVLDQLESKGIDRARVRLVVNRYGQAQELPVTKVEEVLSERITHYVPDDSKTVNHANNHGIPAVVEAPWSKFSRSVAQMVTNLNGQS